MAEPLYDWEEGDAYGGGKRYYGRSSEPILPPIDVRPQPKSPNNPKGGGFTVRSKYTDEVPHKIPDDELDAMLGLAGDFDETKDMGLGLSGAQTAEIGMQAAEDWARRRLDHFNQGTGRA
jgi:hypothetical protein